MSEMGDPAGLSGGPLRLTANPFDQYCYPPVANRDRDWGLFVTGAGRQTVGPDIRRDRHPEPYEYTWEKGRTLSNEFGLLFITAGRAEVLETEAVGKSRLAVGNVVLLFPGVWHRYRFDPKERERRTLGHVRRRAHEAVAASRAAVAAATRLAHAPQRLYSIRSPGC
ncbi:MAG: hypothetical protein U0792_18670 [Gemmataceae bacterium]